MASKTKMASFHDLIRTLFLVLLLDFWLKTKKASCLFFCLVYSYKARNGNFLRLNKNFVSCFFTSFMASKTKIVSFYDLIRPFFLFLFMVLISNKGSFYNLTKCLCPGSYCFVYRFKIHKTVLITKTALTKLLEDTLDESSKLKICLTKYWNVWQNHY